MPTSLSNRYYLEYPKGLAKADSSGREDITGDPALAQVTGVEASVAHEIDEHDDDDGLDDDFDAFEEGAAGADDDFGAFDEGEDTMASAPNEQVANLQSTNAPELSLVSSCYLCPH